jgi:lipoic acid synthetase
MADCWQRRTATLMVLGNTCTRNCRYCSVPSGKPGPADVREPWQVAEAIKRMGLRHAVLTSVTRDDLPDGGAAHIAAVIRAVKTVAPGTTLEVLTPDFRGDTEAIDAVLDAGAEVFSHNIETVERLYAELRGRRCSYRGALSVLRRAADYRSRPIVKSAIMTGHGETPEEVRHTLLDLLEAGCDAVNIGQYLRPSKTQREVAQYVPPEQFREYEQIAYALGFRFVVAGPFVRSSYRSEDLMAMPFVRERLRVV